MSHHWHSDRESAKRHLNPEADVPTYQYACTACGHQLEAVQSFSDEALTECPACEGRLRKLYSAVGIVFKGSGFYRTDSRTGKEKNGGEKKEPVGTPAASASSTSSASSSSGTSASAPASPSGTPASSASSAGSTSSGSSPSSSSS